MTVQFSKHYTLEEARALLPLVRQWLDELDLLQERLKTLDKRVGSLVANGRRRGQRRLSINWRKRWRTARIHPAAISAPVKFKSRISTAA